MPVLSQENMDNVVFLRKQFVRNPAVDCLSNWISMNYTTALVFVDKYNVWVGTYFHNIRTSFSAYTFAVS